MSGSSAVTRKGKRRYNPATRRSWQARLHYAKRRITYYDAYGERRWQRIGLGQDPDEVFVDLEAALDDQVVNGGLTLADLAGQYLEASRRQGLEAATLRGRVSILNCWVLPLIGGELVADWTPERSQMVFDAAAHGFSTTTHGHRAPVGKGQRESIRTVLRGMRDLAHAKRSGSRLLARREDPLDGVNIHPRGRTDSDPSVPPSARPSDTQVATALEAARGHDAEHGTSLHLQITLAAYFGPRLGEQLALRAIDVDLRAQRIYVNGAMSEGDASGGSTLPMHRKVVKNNRPRHVDYWPSLQRPLEVACARALGLDPETATTDQIADAIDAERDRRTVLATAGADDYRHQRAATWWQVDVSIDEELWLFRQPDRTRTWSKKVFNDHWHAIADATADLAASPDAADHGWAAWPTTIPYRNMRHHAAMHLHGIHGSWDVVASILGHTVKVCLERYVRSAHDEQDRIRTAYEGM